jgi:hypothetical protein
MNKLQLRRFNRIVLDTSEAGVSARFIAPPAASTPVRRGPEVTDSID